MKPTKLALIIPSLRGGGAERIMTNLARNLSRDKFVIKLIIVNKVGPYTRLVPNDIEVVDLKSERVRYGIPKLVKEINKFEPNIILSTLGHLNLVILALRPFLSGSPKIFVRQAIAPSKSRTKDNRLFTFLYKTLYPKADLIIAQCLDMKKDIVNTFGIKDSKIEYIYNPLDIDYIKGSMLGDSPYDSNKINYLAVGRLTFQKGFDVLLNAFKIVNKEIPNSNLTILGDGELKEKLNLQMEELGLSKSVRFIGFVDNPYPYYYHSDTYVLSSRYEGFPNTLLEALACGTKVVATDCKSGPKEIIGDNQFGRLVLEEDPQALAEAMIYSVKEENKTKDRANFFSLEKIIKDYEKQFLPNE
ncbi:glycosyltransferase [Alkalihalophilus marmarensis]|uniref:glycosyltransferase n=1 Tax=Alkalihalophilus marmarensis TaxID=521377 RepID=UPI002DB65C4A|nr:glycosyltransferase [Alkalihalophilus marmarensis]MEC2073411.1 glycosyltransferase [Alkalihalophilus marmarensis]